MVLPDRRKETEMKKRWMRMSIHLGFHLRDGETKEQAEDRLVEALETVDDDFVCSWTNEGIEEIEDRNETD